MRNQLIALAIGLQVVTFSDFAAGAIIELPNLSQVVIRERTGGTLTVLTFVLGHPFERVLRERRIGQLTNSNSDWSNGAEFLDFFYSDADGTQNENGNYFTIEGAFNNAADAGVNIVNVELIFAPPPPGSPLVREYANSVASFAAFGTFAVPSSVTNALGNNLSNHTFLGDTVGSNQRLRLTLGFASTVDEPDGVPEPSAYITWGLLGLCAGCASWWRRRSRRSDVR